MTQRKTRAWDKGGLIRPLSSRWRSQLRLEPLEERNLLSNIVIEDFEDGNLSRYNSVLRYYPNAEISPLAAHDGKLGLITHDSDGWLVNDNVTVSQGQTVAAWIKFAGSADGRAYFGFGSESPADFCGQGLVCPLASGHTLSLVLAPNTGEFILYENAGFKFQTNDPTRAGGTILGTGQKQTYVADQWYLVAAQWDTDGTVTGGLFDSDGNLLNTVAGTPTNLFHEHTDRGVDTGIPVTQGGIAFRSFGGDKYWDTITLSDGGSSPRSVHPPLVRHVNAVSPLPAYHPLTSAGPGTDAYPFLYQSVPGTGRDIEISILDQLQQVGNQVFNGKIGLTARNESHNAGHFQIAWGPAVSGQYRVDTPDNPPTIQLYMYRQRPGENTMRIGASGIKKFWDSSQGQNYQFLPPGARDQYQTGHNSTRQSFMRVDAMDPVSGEVDDLSDLGTRDVNGIWVVRARQYDGPFDNLLQVNPDDVDPRLTDINPEGTRWFLAGNEFVVGDEDVSNNSRWTEYVPSWNEGQSRFTFTATGQGSLDICTMPGLPPIGRCVGGAAPSPSQGPLAIAPAAATLLSANATSKQATLAIPTEATPLSALGQVDQAFASLSGQSQEVTQSGVAADVQPIALAHGTEAAVDGVFTASLDHDLFAL